MALIYYLNLIETEQEKSKFELIYNTHRHAMLYVANSVLRDLALAEDAVHEAFLRIINNLHKIEDVGSHKTKAFVVIIAKNIAINLYNKRNRRNESNLYDVGARTAEAPDQIMDEENSVMKAIRGLPQIYAHTMILKYVYELTDKECAKALDISQETVRKRLERGRKMLLEKLEAEEVMKHV